VAWRTSSGSKSSRTPSQKGLGYVIITTQGSMNTPVAFAALVWISVIGLAVYGAVVLAARRIAPWAETSK